MLRRLSRSLLLLAVLALGAAPAAAWEPGPERFGEAVERDLRIPMADGVELAADVYRPSLPDGRPAPGPFPVLVSETPYGKEAVEAGIDGVAGHQPYLVKRGYVQVIVDVRGQGGSGGSFQLFGPQEMADSAEVIEWASNLPGTTGEVGMVGNSYLGSVQLFAAAAAGPDSPLKAVFPIVTSADPYRDLVVSGGLLNVESDVVLAAAYGALPLFSPVAQGLINPAAGPELAGILDDRVADVFAGFASRTLVDVLAGGDRAYDGSFWGDARKTVDVAGQVVANGVPVFLVGGSHDVFQSGTPMLFSALQNAWAGRPVFGPMDPDQPVTGRYQLLVKPEYHTTVDRGEPNLDVLQLAWFDRWLKGENTGIDETDTPLRFVDQDGVERRAARFPLAETSTRTLHLGAGGTLTDTAPAGGGADTLVHLPASLPCDRATEQWALGAGELALEPFGMHDPCAERDLLPQSAGPGQLTYESEPLAEDAVVAGPLAATLYATSTARDTQWVVKVSDVAPDGTSVDVSQGALQGSHRALDDERTWRDGDGTIVVPYHPHTKQAKEPVPTGEVVRYDVEVRPAFRTLRAGHRLRLTLTSAQTPHLVALPEDQPNLAGGVYEVQRTANAPSSLRVPLADPLAFR